MVYQTGQDPISPKSHDTFVYSGVRKVNRPIYGSFHAAVALGFMISLCRGLMSVEKFGSEISQVGEQWHLQYTNDLKDSLKALSDTELNPSGELIFRDLKNLVTRYANSDLI